MGLCLGLLALAVGLFVWEKIPADITALALMSVLLLMGVLTPRDAFIVFSNEAPITVAAMFILSFALIKTGGLEVMAGFLAKTAGHSESRSLIMIFAVAGVASAFVNNTPVVAVLLPVVLKHARDHNLPVSQLLIPLSYAAVLGGLCTLVGTSTNLVVHGMAQARGLPGFTMFELAQIGVPLLIVGTLYTLYFAPRLLPRRDTLTTLLSPAERKPQLVQILIRRDSPLKGKALSEIPWLHDVHVAGIRILEARRRGNRLMDELDTIRLEELDRLTLSVPDEAIQREAGDVTLLLQGQTEKELGFETLTPVEGRIVEAVVSPQSGWEGKTIKQIRLRQRYGLQVLALHRNGKNISSNFANLSLNPGDALLLLGSRPAIEDASSNNENLILLEAHDEPEVRTTPSPWMGWFAAGLIALVILVSTLEWLPISVAAIAACCVLMLFRVIEPKEAYRSIDWPILMIICGTMALGIALEQTGTARWIASNSVDFLQHTFTRENLPWLMLIFFVILTSIFTEFASNNGAAALMVPLALETSKYLEVSPMPFLVAVTISASAAFATPIGYQTNTMVYGAGGYNFRDFLRMGTPLNIICWIIQITLIPMIWKF